MSTRLYRYKVKTRFLVFGTENAARLGTTVRALATCKHHGHLAATGAGESRGHLDATLGAALDTVGRDNGGNVLLTNVARYPSTGPATARTTTARPAFAFCHPSSYTRSTKNKAELLGALFVHLEI